MFIIISQHEHERLQEITKKTPRQLNVVCGMKYHTFWKQQINPETYRYESSWMFRVHNEKAFMLAVIKFQIEFENSLYSESSEEKPKVS